MRPVPPITRARVDDRPAQPRPTIVVAEPDPYLTFLIRLHVPEATVIEADDDQTAQSVIGSSPDLVVVGVEHNEALLADLLSHPARPKVLAVMDGSRARRTTIPTDVDGILTRPFVPSELHRAVRVSLGLDRPAEPAEPPTSMVARARRWLAPARLGGIAIAAVLEVAGTGVSPARARILALAFVYATARWAFRRRSVVVDGADVALAIALVAATGGVTSNYFAFAFVVSAGSGLLHGPLWGGLAGLAIVTGSIPIALGEPTVGPREFAAWFTLFPLLGTAGGFAARLAEVSSVHPGFELLSEANRVLSSLYRIARTLPGGLELTTVADAALGEIRDTLRSGAGAMLVSEAGTLSCIGAFGVVDPGGLFVRDHGRGLGLALNKGAMVLKREELHPLTAEAVGERPCWLVAPLRRESSPVGLLMAACSNHAQHDQNLALLRRLADEVAIAVENARLFQRVREISIDEERRRLARELHDGIAQALTHLRYELDFMGRHGDMSPESVSKEVKRLSRVVARASDDVRSVILGLRASVATEGLAGALRSYLSDLRGLGGPEIVLDARGDVRLSHDVEGEVFRIAQEAVSNAVRHARANEIVVSLHGEGNEVELTVEDDGLGFGNSPAEETTGVGLAAMQERASSIGAALEVGEKPGGGVRIRLTYRGNG